MDDNLRSLEKVEQKVLRLVEIASNLATGLSEESVDEDRLKEELEQYLKYVEDVRRIVSSQLHLLTAFEKTGSDLYINDVSDRLKSGISDIGNGDLAE